MVGDLIIGDARLLHAAWPNTMDTWCTCSRGTTISTFRSRRAGGSAMPEEILQYNAEEEAPPGTRKPRNSAQEAAAAVARL